MKIFLNKIFKNNRRKSGAIKTILAVVLFCVVLGLVAVKPVFAASTLQTSIVMLLSWITASIAYVLGYILTLIIDVLATVAQYNNIIDVAAVKVGWVIIRDLANIFFVLVLLVIAFATILRIESYNAKKLLPKLLIMAVLVNFSKTIFGVIIDLSQIIMLTFVNGFSANNATGNFVQMFQVEGYLSFDDADELIDSVDKNTETGNLAWNVLLGFVAGTIALIITLIVMVVLLAVLIIRIIMLWVYTILSPFVFIGAAFPGMQKYTSLIWEDFIKYVVVGPILAFFIWLALFTAADSAKKLKYDIESNDKIEKTEITAGNKLFSTSNFQTYIITIALLIGGLMVTQQIGGAAGSIAGKGLTAARNAGMKYTGARFVSERWGAFQSMKDAKRKEKAAATGERMFGVYSSIKQAPKSFAQGIYSLTTAKLPGFRNIQFIKNLKAKSEEKYKARKSIYDAANYFKENQDAGDHTIGDYTYIKNSRGGIDVKKKIKRGEKEILEEVKGAGMSKTGLEYMQAYRQSFSPARQIIDQTTKSRVDKLKGNFDNLSSGELKRILKNAVSSKDKKLTASLKLLERGDFDHEDQFNSGKQYTLRLPSVSKEWNEIADKLYGRWNNSDEEFKRKIDNKVIDPSVLDPKQFKGNMGLLADTLGKEFSNFVKKVEYRGVKATNELKTALNNKIGSYSKVDMDDPQQKRVRNAYAGSTGNLNTAFKDDRNAKINFITGANTDQLDNLMDVQENHELLREHISPVQADRFRKAHDKDANKVRQIDDWVGERNRNEDERARREVEREKRKAGGRTRGKKR